MTSVYYDRKGRTRRIHVQRDCGGYCVYLDGKFYGQGDDRADANEMVRDIIADKHLSETPPKKRVKKITPPKPASEVAE